MRKFFEWLEEWSFDDNIFIGVGKMILVVGGAAFLICLPFILLNASDPHISLNKTDWSCARSHKTMVPMLIGKIVVPQYIDICDEYTMNGY